MWQNHLHALEPRIESTQQVSVQRTKLTEKSSNWVFRHFDTPAYIWERGYLKSAPLLGLFPYPTLPDRAPDLTLPDRPKTTARHIAAHLKHQLHNYHQLPFLLLLSFPALLTKAVAERKQT